MERPQRSRRTKTKDWIIQALHEAGGELGSIRLRMTVEEHQRPIPDATWYGSLDRLVQEGLVTDPSNGATLKSTRALLDSLTDFSVPAGRGMIELTKAGRGYAVALHLASLVPLSDRSVVERDLDLALSAASA